MKPAKTLEPTAPAGGEAPEISSPGVRGQVMAYWRTLGLADPELIASLTQDCLHRAMRRVGRGSDEELLRRALEEVQRRFDHALARALGLPPSNDPHPVTAARAAFLLDKERVSADALFGHGDAAEVAKYLQKILPRSTPPEAHLSMPEAPLRFWLFKSPHHR